MDSKEQKIEMLLEFESTLDECDKDKFEDLLLCLERQIMERNGRG